MGREAKREMVIDCIRHLPATFRYADIERPCPEVNRPTIVRVLGELRDNGEIRCTKGGRDAAWLETPRRVVDNIICGQSDSLGDRGLCWATIGIRGPASH